MRTPSSDSPAMIPDADATRYLSASFGNDFSKIRAMSAPMNIESELKNGITNASPTPVAEGTNLRHFSGRVISSAGIKMPTMPPTIIPIFASGCSASRPLPRSLATVAHTCADGAGHMSLPRVSGVGMMR